MIVVLLSQTCVRERRATIISEREQESCLREQNNNHVRERRATIISEREQQLCLREENNNHI
jgi:hypothetical protein